MNVCGVWSNWNIKWSKCHAIYFWWILVREKEIYFLSSDERQHHAILTTHSSSFEKTFKHAKLFNAKPNRSLIQRWKGYLMPKCLCFS